MTVTVKNEEFETFITDLGEDGAGIGRTDGFTWFIKDTVIGDRVLASATKVKKQYGYARLIRVLDPSPYRTDPVCPVTRACGGCQIRQMDYAAQLAWKEKKVTDNLIRIGGFAGAPALTSPILGMADPGRYRSKAVYPVRRDKNGRLIAGFYAARTHSVIPCGDCLIGAKENADVLKTILQHMEEYRIDPYDEVTHRGIVRHVLIRQGFHTGELMVCLVINADGIRGAERLTDRLREQFPHLRSLTLNINRDKGNVIMGRELKNLYGPGYIEDTIRGIRFRISPLSFFQVNPVQMEVLYGKALEYADLKGRETVWDLYCGVGSISLFLSMHAKQVYGVEIIPDAVENAKENASLNQFGNLRFYTGRAEEVLPRWYEEFHIPADVIVTDPPRKGCDPQCLETMLRMAPQRIVYVSCNPATLARDLRILCDGGYELKKVQPVDMFPHTVHIETVVQLSKGNISSQNVRVEFSLEDMDMSRFQQGATYEQIQAWVQEKYGFHVTHLNIAKTKRKCGIIERENYNFPKSEDSQSPKTPKEKEEAIIDAFLHFKMM